MPSFNQCELAFTGEETFEDLLAIGQQLVIMSQSNNWWAGDLFNKMLDDYPERGKVISSNNKWITYAETAKAYTPAERVKGVSFEIHAYLRGKDDRHKQLVLAHQSGHTLKDVKDRNSDQVTHDLGKGKRLTTKHMLMLETIAEVNERSISVAGQEFKFKTLKGVETAEKAIKLAVETALKGR